MEQLTEDRSQYTINDPRVIENAAGGILFFGMAIFIQFFGSGDDRLFFLLFFSTPGVVILGYAWWRRKRNRDLINQGIVVEGKVLRKYTHRLIHHKIRFQYEHERRRYTRSVGTYEPKQYRVGDDIPILVNPNNPGQSLLVGDFGLGGTC